MDYLQIGGYGLIAHGRHKYGARDSLDFDIIPQILGPRFNASSPLDGAHNVSRNRWVTFELYNYSSTFNYDDPSGDGNFPIEISEDGGSTWEYANVAPYSCIIRARNAQIAWVRITKSSLWTDNAEVVLRTSVLDEFGQDASKEFPVRWE